MLLAPRRWLVAACLAAALVASPAASHESAPELLARLDAALASAPRDAEFWHRRAALERIAGDLGSARADLERACAFGLAPALAAREQGLLARAEHRLPAAERHLRRAGELAPGDGEIQAAHAQVLAELGRFRDAADAYARAIQRSPGAGPDLHLARVRALAAVGEAGLPEALRAVDEAVARLGPIPGLVQEGVALELRAHRIDAALARLDQLAAPGRRGEHWRLQRAEILEQAGRRQQAAGEYAAALAAVESVPPARRATPAASLLAARASQGLARVEARDGGAPR